MAAVYCDSTVRSETIYRYSWTIQNFAAICHNVLPNTFVRSPVFTSVGNKSNLYMKICPNSPPPENITLNSQGSNIGIGSFSFSPASLNRSRSSVNFGTINHSRPTFGVEPKKYIILTVEELSGYFDYCTRHVVKANVIIKVLNAGEILRTFTIGNKPQYLNQNEILQKVNGNYDTSLTLSCEIIENIDEGIYPDTLIGRRLKEFDDFELLLHDDEHSDVTLIVGEEKLLAHKCILSRKSAVFAAMFKHDMLESEMNLVDIKDFKVEVIKEFLSFVYTGKVGDIKSLSCELYEAADKYSVEGLKSVCEDVMCQNISTTNVYEYLNFALFHGINKLKNASIEFISSHKNDLMSAQ